MKRLTEREISALFAAPAGKRLKYFVTRVADAEAAWMISDGSEVFRLMSGGAGDALPLWPSAEFAEVCRQSYWPDCHVRSMSLHELMNTLLPSLAMDATRVAVLLAPDGTSAVLPAHELRALLAEYLQEYFSEDF